MTYLLILVLVAVTPLRCPRSLGQETILEDVYLQSLRVF